LATGRNASERRASLEKDDAQADPMTLSGKVDTQRKAPRLWNTRYELRRKAKLLQYHLLMLRSAADRIHVP